VPFIKGVTENLPNAEIIFDKFHAVKIINDARMNPPFRSAGQPGRVRRDGWIVGVPQVWRVRLMQCCMSKQGSPGLARCPRR
jgi:hypothetical protein